MRDENPLERKHRELYRGAIEVLTLIGLQNGVQPISVGHKVRVRYVGSENHFDYQGREGVVEDIMLTQEAIDDKNPELLKYRVRTSFEGRNDSWFTLARWRLEKLEQPDYGEVISFS